jgi:hypothetical protein
VEREAASILRGNKIVAYFTLVGILAFTFIYVLSDEFKFAPPSENIITAGLFFLLMMIFCIVLFIADAFSGDIRQGNAHLFLLAPRKPVSVLISKITIPILLFYLSVIFFSVFLFVVPNSGAFMKLWLARILVDTLLFFTLLFFAVVISITLKPTFAPMLTVTVLLLFLFLSPYTHITIPVLNYINPIAAESEIMHDFSDGKIENLSPVYILVVILAIFMAASYLRITRMEVKE